MSESVGASSGVQDLGERMSRTKIAKETLAAIDNGSYILDSVTYDLRTGVEECKRGTKYFSPDDAVLSAWRELSSPDPAEKKTEISFLEISTLDGARYLTKAVNATERFGILNFASAKSPGGGFLGGSRAQEESIARSSTLYPSLKTETAQQYYMLHNANPRDGFYTHAMIYSPGVVIIRDDAGACKEPVAVDVVTSPAVNAGVVRKSKRWSGDEQLEGRIEDTMRERMGRILYLFEKEGLRNIVLGSFGTGAFRNKVGMVAEVWRELLDGPAARFGRSFDRVEFAILGRETFEEVRSVFGGPNAMNS